MFKLAYDKADVAKQLAEKLDRKFSETLLKAMGNNSVTQEMGTLIIGQITEDFKAAQVAWLKNKEGKAPKIKAFQHKWLEKAIDLTENTKHPLKGVLTSKK